MATPTYAQVISQINTFIVTNHNNEITANVLNPILVLLTDFTNNTIGDLNTLTTDQKDTIVNAINSLKNNFNDLTNNGVQLYTGMGDPNDTPPPTYKPADFYLQVDSDSLPVQLWQFNAFDWIVSGSGGTSPAWGFITGNIDEQIDLKIKLDSKEDTANKQNSMVFDGTGLKFPTVDAVNIQANNISRAVINTGFLDTTDTFSLFRVDDFTLGINASQFGIAFSQKFKTPPYAPSDGIIQLTARNVPLSAIGLTGTGTAIKFVGYRASDDSIVFSDTQFIQSPSVCQLGVVLVKFSGGVTSFIDATRTVITIPDVAAYNNLQTVSTGVKATTSIAAIAGTLSHSNTLGKLVGISVAWGTSNNDSKVIPLNNPTPFTRLHPGNALTVVPPATFTTLDPTQYWNGTALVAVGGGAGVSTVQRLLFTVNGNFVWQYGQATYANLVAAQNNILQAVFTNILPEGTFAEVGRMAITKGCTDLASANAQYYPTGSSGGGGVSPISPTAWGFITGSIDDQLDLKAKLDLKANDADVVHKAGNETIAGIKTFSNIPWFQSGIYFSSSNSYTSSSLPLLFNNNSKLGMLSASDPLSRAAFFDTSLIRDSGVSGSGQLFTFPNASGTFALTSQLPVNPITGTAAAGQVAFFTGASTQAGDAGFTWNNTSKLLTVKSIAIDNANGTVYNSLPTQNLHIGGANYTTIDSYNGVAWIEQVRVANNGNTGFGTITPQEKIHALGRIKFSVNQSANDAGYYGLLESFQAPNTGVLAFVGAGGAGKVIGGENYGTDTVIYSNNSAKIRVLDNGNTGFGVPNPFAKVTIPTGANNNGFYGIDYATGQAASKRWAITNDIVTYGDFGIKTETTQGSTIQDLVRFYIAPSGNVGFLTTNPYGQVHVNSPLGGAGNGATITKGLTVGETGTNGVLNMGTDATGAFYSWIQSRNTSTANYYALVLNPYGGNIGVGTTSLGNARVTIDGAAGGDTLLLRKSTGASFAIEGATGTVNPVLMGATNTTNPDLFIYVGGSNRLAIINDGTLFVSPSVRNRVGTADKGQIVLNVGLGTGGIEFNSDGGGNGYGTKITNNFDGNAAYDMVFKTRVDSNTWLDRVTIKGANGNVLIASLAGATTRAVTVLADGTLSTTAIGGGNATSGSYTPTIVSPINLTGINNEGHNWTRIGNIVTVHGVVNISSINASQVESSFILTTPTNIFASGTNVMGSGVVVTYGANNIYVPCAISGNGINQVNCSFLTGVSSASFTAEIHYSFSYVAA